MVSASRAEAYSRNQAQVVKLARRELGGFWKLLDKSDPVAVKAAMSDFMVTLVEAYGPISATVAADYYDEIRAEAGAPHRFTARPGGAVDPVRVAASSDWAVQPLFGQNADEAALARLTGSAQRYIQEYGRKTLVENAKRDPAKPKYARVPHGDTCAFCRLLASRGADYHSEASAGEKGVNDFHDDCDCQIVPAFVDDDLPYDPETYLNEYLDAREEADSGSTKKILSSMREQQDTH